MASGKITPRQKMINMMYLVLTALLALNVSTELLNSIKTIADSLNNSAEKMEVKNHHLAESMREHIVKEEAKGNVSHAYVKALIAEVLKKTDELDKFLSAHVDSMTVMAGVKPDSTLENLQEAEKPFRYWMKGKGDEHDNDGRGAGKAIELRKTLEAYTRWANDFHAKYSDDKSRPFPPPCPDPKDNPQIPRGSEQKRKPWELYTFDHNTPVVATIAMLEKFRNDARVIEAELLETLKGRLKDIPYPIDRLELVDVPESGVIIAGQSFKTKLFVVASSSRAKPEYGGVAVPKLNADGSADMTLDANKIMAQAKFVGEHAEVPYTATVKINKTGGGDTVMKITRKFKVLRPVVEIEDMSSKNRDVYFHCRNEYSLIVPEALKTFKIEYDVKGAELKTSENDSRKFLILPKEKTVKLTPYIVVGGQKITLKKDPEIFNALEPDRPELTLTVGGKEWNGRDYISAKSKIAVVAKASDKFRDKRPKDANYEIEGCTLTVRRGLLNTTYTPKIGPGGTINLATVLNDVRKGDVLYIEIDEVKRKNFQNKLLPQAMSAANRSLVVSLTD